jgi:glycine cleavage system H protein
MKDINELNLPGNLRYDAEHEWVSLAAPCRVGVSDYAQDALGDLTYVELPDVGARFAKGDEFGTLESTKSVSPLFLPLDGTITAVNEALADDPGLVNSDPYGKGWIVEIEPSDLAQGNALMDAAAYKKHLESLGD